MLTLNNLKPGKGARKPKRIVGRGAGSGSGKTSGRGQKGQYSRSGKGIRPGFEGGQMPLIRRLPKRGFTNMFKQQFQVVNLKDLNRLQDNAVVSPEELRRAGLISTLSRPVKILGTGTLEKKKLHVKAHKFSETAAKAIEALGGKVEAINA